MSARTINGRLAVIVVALTLGACACDAVRPVGYWGTFPDPVPVGIPQTPDFQAAASMASDVGARQSLTVDVLSWRLTSPRAWTPRPDNIEVGSVALAGTALPTSVDGAQVWPGLVGSFNLSPSTDRVKLVTGIIETSIQPTVGSPVLVAADISHVLFVATEAMDIQPIGPAGPTITVAPGFHVFERACTPDGQQSFTEVPSAGIFQTIEGGSIPATSLAPPPDPAVAGCGIDATPVVDLGTAAAPIPPDPGNSYAPSYSPAPRDPSAPLVPPAIALMQVDALAWSPGGDGIYLLAERPDISFETQLPSAQLRYLGIGASATSLVTSDDIVPPLTIATGGTSALVWRKNAGNWDYVRQALTAAVTPLQVSLSGMYADGPAYPSETVLSPDGNVLVLSLPEGIGSSTGWFTFVDLRTGNPITLALPDPYAPPSTGYAPYTVVPRAWDPTGTALLVEAWPGTDDGVVTTPNPPHAFAVIPVVAGTGALPASLGAPMPLPATLSPSLATGHASYGDDTATRFFWSSAGPQVLIQDPDGAYVYNFVTQQTGVLVEPTRVAVAAAATDVAVATEQAFAWAIQCFGLAETSCRAELRRLSLLTGVVDVVATADQARPFAVSPDGKQVAFADDANIYFKAVPP